MMTASFLYTSDILTSIMQQEPEVETCQAMLPDQVFVMVTIAIVMDVVMVMVITITIVITIVIAMDIDIAIAIAILIVINSITGKAA